MTMLGMWKAAKFGTTGVRFGDVFDGHVADFLEKTTPGGPESTSE